MMPVLAKAASDSKTKLEPPENLWTLQLLFLACLLTLACLITVCVFYRKSKRLEEINRQMMKRSSELQDQLKRTKVYHAQKSMIESYSVYQESQEIQQLFAEAKIKTQNSASAQITSHQSDKGVEESSNSSFRSLKSQSQSKDNLFSSTLEQSQSCLTHQTVDFGKAATQQQLAEGEQGVLSVSDPMFKASPKTSILTQSSQGIFYNIESQNPNQIYVPNGSTQEKETKQRHSFLDLRGLRPSDSVKLNVTFKHKFSEELIDLKEDSLGQESSKSAQSGGDIDDYWVTQVPYSISQQLSCQSLLNLKRLHSTQEGCLRKESQPCLAKINESPFDDQSQQSTPKRKPKLCQYFSPMLGDFHAFTHRSTNNMSLHGMNAGQFILPDALFVQLKESRKSMIDESLDRQLSQLVIPPLLKEMSHRSLEPQGSLDTSSKLTVDKTISYVKISYGATKDQSLQSSRGWAQQIKPSAFSQASAQTMEVSIQKSLESDFSLCLENFRYQRSFEEICELGEGGFGKVFQARHRLDQNLYAVKKIRIHLGIEQDIKNHQVYREIMAMPQLSHKNIVRYFSCWVESVDPTKLHLQRAIRQFEIQQARLDKKRQSKCLPQKSQLLEESSPSHHTKPLKAQKPQNREGLVQLNCNMEDELEEAFDAQSLRSLTSSDIENDSEQADDDSQNDDDDDDDAIESDSLMDDSSDDEDFDQDDDDQESQESIIDFIKNKQSFITLDVMIQMEYCSGMTLKDYLDSRSRVIQRQENLYLFKQLLSGLKHLHEKGLIHRDIKPANIFLSDNLSLKIGDFGLAKEQDIMNAQFKKMNAHLDSNEDQEINKKAGHQHLQKTWQAGTPLYQSPEQLSKTSGEVNEKVDIYAAGLILLEMCSKFSTQHHRSECIYALKKHRKVPEDLECNYAIETKLILVMTDPKPEKRPSAKELLSSEIFKHWALDVKY